MLDEALNKDPNLQRLLNSDPDLKAEAEKNNGYFSESQKKWIKYLCLTAAVGLVVGLSWWLSKHGGSGAGTGSGSSSTSNGTGNAGGNIPVVKINENWKIPVIPGIVINEVGGPRGPQALEMASSELLASKASKLVGAGVAAGISAGVAEKVVENLLDNPIIVGNTELNPNTFIFKEVKEINVGGKLVKVVSEKDAILVKKLHEIEIDLESERAKKQEERLSLLQKRAERKSLAATLEQEQEIEKNLKHELQKTKLELAKVAQDMAKNSTILDEIRERKNKNILESIAEKLETEINENQKKQQFISFKLDEEYAALKASIEDSKEKRFEKTKLARESVINYVVDLQKQKKDCNILVDQNIEYFEKNVILLYNEKGISEKVTVQIIREQLPKVMSGQNVIDSMSITESMRLCKYKNEYGIVYCEDRLILHADIQRILDQVYPHISGDKFKASQYLKDIIWNLRVDDSNPKYHNASNYMKNSIQYAEELYRVVAWLKCGSGQPYLHFWKIRNVKTDPDALD
jgi:hypothetical protein